MTRGYRSAYYGIQLRGGVNGNGELDALKQFLEDALAPLDLHVKHFYDILFNTLLVAAGARTGTLVESADYGTNTHLFDGIVRALQSAPLPPHVKQGFRKGVKATPQYLLYSAALPAHLVRSALNINSTNTQVAMGKVLGFQCAGQLASPYSVKFNVFPGEGEEGYNFYTEACADHPDEDVLEEMERKFQAVAAPYGWHVDFYIDRGMLLDELLEIMQRHSAAELNEYRMEVLQNVTGEMLYELATYLEQRDEWDESTIEWPLVVAALIATQHDPLSVLYGDLTTAESAVIESTTAEGERMLLPSYRRELKSRRVTRVETMTDLLALLAQHDVARVNGHRDDVMRLLNGTMLEGVVERYVEEFMTTWQLDALYVMLVFRELHSAAEPFMPRIFRVDPDAVDLALHELAYALFDKFADGMRGGGLCTRRS